MGENVRSSRPVRRCRREPNFLAMLEIDRMPGDGDYDPDQFIKLGEVVDLGDCRQRYVPRGRQARQQPPAE